LILNFLLQKLSVEERDRAIKNFCHAKINYDVEPINEKNGLVDQYQNWKSREMGVVQQSNGQLMGNVLSFPVLCLANYLIFRHTITKFNNMKFAEKVEKLSYDDLVSGVNHLPKEVEVPRVLINGDDILFCCSQEVYDFWCVETRRNGFFPSVGKNLFSSEVCQINSVLFDVRYDGNQGEEFVRNIEVINYLSMGTITGRGKGKEDPMERKSITQCEDETDALEIEVPSFGSNLRSFSWTEKFISKEECLKLFLHHRPDLNNFLKKNKWIYERSFDSWSSINSKEGSSLERSWSGLYMETQRESEFDVARYRDIGRRNPFYDLNLDFSEHEQVKYMNSL